MLTGDEIVILDREMQRLRAENAKLKDYLVQIADPTVDREESIGLAREALGWPLED